MTLATTTEGWTYEVDARGHFCRHCGRSTWRHYRRDGKLYCIEAVAQVAMPLPLPPEPLIMKEGK